MKNRHYLLIWLIVPLCAAELVEGKIAAKNSFIRDISRLPTGLQLPLRDAIEEVKISFAKIKSRVMRYRSDLRVEPVKLKVRDKSLRLFSEQFSRRGHTVYLYQGIKKSKQPYKNPREIIITPEILRHIDQRKLTSIFSTYHHRLLAYPQKMSKRKKYALLNQMKYFFSSAALRKIKKKLLRPSPIVVDRDLLPEFAARMVRRYTIFRGPNCFHAVLAFQDPALPKSTFLNVKEEIGYHRAMINHDELWRVLDENFYEINPRTTKLNYGDIIVFFKVPENSNEPPSYKWLKHTSVYLFNNYTFSKGSKSSNSPYTIKTMQEEWRAWRKILKNPAIKVFRRASRNLNKKFISNLKDWLH